MQAAWANRDHEELRAAIWNWLTRPVEKPGVRRAMAGKQNGAIAYAFELWIRHLTLLERFLDTVPAGWQELLASEMAGLEMLREGRKRFAAEYRQCADCGAAVRGKICPRCGALESRPAAGI